MAHKRELQLVTLVFTQDFAVKKAGDEGIYNTMMASDILRKGVAFVKGAENPDQKPVIKKQLNKKKNEKNT